MPGEGTYEEGHPSSTLEDVVTPKLRAQLTEAGPCDLKRILNALDLTPLSTFAGDPLFAWIDRVSRGKAILVTFGIFLASCIPLAVAALEGNFSNRDLQVDVVRDLGYINQYIIFLPTIVLIMHLYFTTLPKTILTLCSSSVFQVSRHKYEALVVRGNELYRHRGVLIFPWVIGLVGGAGSYSYYGLGDFDTWHSPASGPLTIAGWLNWPLALILYYAVAAGVVRILVTYLLLRRLFQLDVNIQPLHPDRCGGLAPLGELSMKLNLATFLFGVVAGLGTLANVRDYGLPFIHPTNIAIIVGYFLGAGVVFFFPLYAAHRAMKEARYTTLDTINRRFDSISREIMEDIAGTGSVSPELVARLERVHKFYNIAERMPIYPFNAAIVSSFFGSVLTPLLIFVIEYFLRMALGS